MLLGALRKTKSLNWNHSLENEITKKKLHRISGRKNGQPKTFSLQKSYPQPASISYQTMPFSLKTMLAKDGDEEQAGSIHIAP